MMPRLSETLATWPKHPLRCQACGRQKHEIVDGVQQPVVLDRWRECTELDVLLPNSPVVALCKACTAALITPHPRLYHQLSPYEPWPGTCAICVDCVHRRDTHCVQSRAYGGNGLSMQVEHFSALVCRGGGRGGRTTVYAAEPHGCTHRETT